MLGRKAEVGDAAGNRRDDVAALALLDIDVDIRVFAQEAASAFGKCSDSTEVLASRCTLALAPLAKAARSPRIASTWCMTMRA